MKPEKLLVVTVGTSLFHSASWNEKNPDFCKELGKADAKKYQTEWANPGDNRNLGGLHSPKLRMRNGGALEDRFKEKLIATEKNVARWAEWVALPVEEGALMRYSAEISTIISFAQHEGRRSGKKWQEILQEYYIDFICDNDQLLPANVAARHNRVYLQRLFDGNPDHLACKEFSYLSNLEPHLLYKGLLAFQTYLKEMQAWVKPVVFKNIDIVISGGYKIFGLLGFGFLLDERFRIIYQHEESNKVFIQDKDTLSAEDFPASPLTAINQKKGS